MSKISRSGNHDENPCGLPLHYTRQNIYFPIFFRSKIFSILNVSSRFTIFCVILFFYFIQCSLRLSSLLVAWPPKDIHRVVYRPLSEGKPSAQSEVLNALDWVLIKALSIFWCIELFFYSDESLSPCR